MKKHIDCLISLFIGLSIGIIGTLSLTNQTTNENVVLEQQREANIVAGRLRSLSTVEVSTTEAEQLADKTEFTNKIAEKYISELTTEQIKYNIPAQSAIINSDYSYLLLENEENNFDIVDLSIPTVMSTKFETSTEVSEEEEPVEEAEVVLEQSMYASTYRINVRENPTLDDEVIIGTLDFAEEVKVLVDSNNEPIEISEDYTGDIDDSIEWVQCIYEGDICYVSSEYLEEEKPEAPDESSTYNNTWTGEVLNSRNGVVMGPSGKESYYNLNMNGVIQIMRNMGNDDEYWVRSDGAKMLGPYIMVAADLSVHPRGSLVETTLGTGIVCDTGGFVYSTDRALDIAVAW